MKKVFKVVYVYTTNPTRLSRRLPCDYIFETFLENLSQRLQCKYLWETSSEMSLGDSLASTFLRPHQKYLLESPMQVHPGDLLRNISGRHP